MITSRAATFVVGAVWFCAAGACGPGQEQRPAGNPPPSQETSGSRRDAAPMVPAAGPDAGASRPDMSNTGVFDPPPPSRGGPTSPPPLPAADRAPFTGKLDDARLSATLALTLDGGVIVPPIGKDARGFLHVYDGRTDVAGRDDLQLFVDFADGAVRARTSAFAKGFNTRLHRGSVTAQRSGGRWQINVDLPLTRDEMAGADGDRAIYTINVATAAGGTFTGTFQGKPVQGNVVAALGHPWPAKVDGVAPLAKGEHPRLMFRKGDLAKLRQRAQAAPISKVVELMRAQLPRATTADQFGWGGRPASAYQEGSYALGNCLLWSLFADAADAERGKTVEQIAITRMDGEWGGWANNLRRFEGAIAYDLCHEVWDATFKQQVTAFLARDSGKNRWRPDSPIDLAFAMADGLSALALMGDGEDANGAAAERLAVALDMFRWATTIAIGQQGFTHEMVNYTDAFYVMLPFAHAMRTALGQDIATGTGIAKVVALALQTDAYMLRNDWGAPEYHRLWGFAGQVPAVYRPALRAMIDEHPKHGYNQPTHGLWMLLNYPDDVPARPKAQGGLPLALLDEGMGAFAVRNGHGPDSAQAILQLRTNPTRTSVTAGDLILVVGGRRWSGAITSGGGYFVTPTLPYYERTQIRGTAWLPQVPLVEGAVQTGGARATSYKVGADGSLLVNARHGGWIEGDYWQDLPTSVSHHDYRHAISKPPTDLGIGLTQSTAVDFSKASGHPVLVAVSYRFTGGAGRNKGLMLTGLGGPVTLTNSIAHVARPGRENAAPMISARAALVTDRPPTKVESIWGGDEGGYFTRVYGADRYLWVFAPGATQDPQVTGSGDGASVIIGGQTITVQNDALVLKVPPR